MKGSIAKVIAAKAEAERARAKLADDIDRLKHQASPAVIAEGIRADLVEKAKAKPVAIGAGAVGAALLLAVPAVRRLASTVATKAWRNRAAIGRFITRKSGPPAPQGRKDKAR